jgi:hypothetical protein
MEALFRSIQREMRYLNKNNMEKMQNKIEKLKIKIERENTEVDLQKAKNLDEFNKLEITKIGMDQSKIQPKTKIFKMSNQNCFTIQKSQKQAENPLVALYSTGKASVPPIEERAIKSGQQQQIPELKQKQGFLSKLGSLFFKKNNNTLKELGEYRDLKTNSFINDIYDNYNNDLEKQPQPVQLPPVMQLSNTRYLTYKPKLKELLPINNHGFTIKAKRKNNIKECHKLGVITYQTDNLYPKLPTTSRERKLAKHKLQNTAPCIFIKTKNYKFEALNQELQDMLQKHIELLHEFTRKLNKNKTMQENAIKINAQKEKVEKQLKELQDKLNIQTEQLNDIKQNKGEMIREYKEKANKALEKKINRYRNIKSTAIGMFNKARAQKQQFIQTKNKFYDKKEEFYNKKDQFYTKNNIKPKSKIISNITKDKDYYEMKERQQAEEEKYWIQKQYEKALEKDKQPNPYAGNKFGKSGDWRNRSEWENWYSQIGLKPPTTDPPQALREATYSYE